MKKILFLLAITLIIWNNSKSQDEKDALDQLLEEMDISYEQFGFKPKGYWTRYPLPSDHKYQPVAFTDLMAEPQFIYDYVNNIAVSVNTYLDDKYLEKNSDAILKLGFYGGLLHQTSEFRAYGASLWAELTEKQPLLNAIKDLYAASGRVFTYNRIGQPGEFPLNEKDLKNALKNLHPDVQLEVAKAIINLTEAYRFAKLAMRNVDYEDAVNAWRIRHLGETQFDGMEFYPSLADAAEDIDINSLYYAGIKLMAVGEELADALTKLKEENKDIDWKKQNFEWVTPIGRIVISGADKNEHHYTDALLVVDLGGDDTYYGSVGANPSLEIPVSLCVDLDGDDVYNNEDEFTHSQGAGLFGAGVLIDLKGDDEYISTRLSQGAAMLGIGILADIEGDDKYEMWTSGQGGAYFGVGVAMDNTGDDEYKIWGDGQGYGGIGGIGTLINKSGDDHYYAEKDTAKVFRIDNWHSHEGQYNYSYVQGCGVGRRGDVTDGHSWSGGMGTLIDLEGDDKYEAGGWSQGCGYWYGMGFLMDKSGDDEYHSTHWAQAAGAHFAIGCLFDEGGDDKHINWGKLAAGIGFGHDYVISILYNKGGDDLYKVHNDGFGYAINKSQVFFIDTEGEDTYIRGKGHQYGWNNFTANNPPAVSSIYHLYSDQICIFADLMGEDNYLIEDFETGKQEADTLIKNNFQVFYPSQEERENLSSQRYYGIGKDFENYEGREIEIFRNKMKE